MNTQNQNLIDLIASKFNDLIHDALKYQLALNGNFYIANNKDNTTIDNDTLSEFGIQYITSGRLDFDGGIEINFLMAGHIGEMMLKLFGSNSLIGKIFNLESTDGEYDLELFALTDSGDCERISIDFNLSDYSSDSLTTLIDLIDSHINSDSIGKLNTFSRLKLGS